MNNNTPIASSQKQFTWELVSNKDGTPATLDENQKTIITSAFDQMNLNLKNNYKLKVTVLSEDSFRIIVNDKTTFFVKKRDGVSPPLVLTHDGEKQSIFSSFKNFWDFILHLFYLPLFHPTYEERSPQNAVIEDYRLLRKSLESGHYWLDPEREGSFSSEQTAQLQANLQQAISTAKEIEGQLHSRRPKKALEAMQKTLATALVSMAAQEQKIIPVGYLNREQQQLPIMLRFYKDHAGSLFLEIYSLAPEGGTKVNPTQTVAFLPGHSEQDVEKVLALFFSPLVPEQANQALLQKAVTPSKTFGNVAAAIKQETLGKMNVNLSHKKKEPNASIEHDSGTACLTFVGIMQSIDHISPETIQRVQQPQGKLTTAADCPVHRLCKWLDHLQAINPHHTKRNNSRLELLYRLTNEWVEQQLQKVDNSRQMPSSQQLEIYESCSVCIDHTIHKIAKEINGGQPCDAEGIPPGLTDKQKLCREKVEQIRETIRREKREASAGQHEKPQGLLTSYSVGGGAAHPRSTPKGETATLPAVVDPRVVVSGAVGAAAKITAGAIDWDAAREGLRPPAGYPAQRARAALSTLIDNLTSERKATAQQLLTEERYKELVGFLVEELLVKDKLFDIVIEDLKDNSTKYIMGFSDIQEKVNVIQQFIICPRLLPSQTLDGTLITYFFRLFRVIQDENSCISDSSKSATELLRVLLQIRHLIPQQQMLTYEQEQLSTPHKDSSLWSLPAAVSAYTSLELTRSQQQEKELTVAINVQETVGKFVQSFHNLADQCIANKEAAAVERDLKKKYTALQRIQEDALQLLTLLPPPEASGLSIWYGLTSQQRQEACAKLFALETMIWEAQLQLAEAPLDPKARFLLIKAQTIRMALIRADVHEVQEQTANCLQAVLKTAGRTALEFLGQDVFHISATNELVVDWNKITPDHVQKLMELARAHRSIRWPDVQILAFGRYTVDVRCFNMLLSQDLTALLSRDADLERDLFAVYHFLVRDYNQGTRESIGGKELQKHFLIRKSWMSEGQCIEFKNIFADTSSAKEYARQLEHANLFYRTASDPNYTLYTHSPVKGVSYFQAMPDMLLRQKKPYLDSGDGEVVIRGDNGDISARVYVNGHPDFAFIAQNSNGYSAEDKQERIRPQKPFLPIVENDNLSENKILEDLRTHNSSIGWWRYAALRTEQIATEISVAIFRRLLLLRQAPPGQLDRAETTSYAVHTAQLALLFLVDPKNQGYLANDQIQKYIEETLFGSFLMQQALLAHPEIFCKYLEQLKERVESAYASNDLLLAGFLSNVVYRIDAHVCLAAESLQKEGYFSLAATGSLPAHVGVTGGIFDRWCTIMRISVREIFQQQPQRVAGLNCMQVEQPLLFRLQHLQRCIETLSQLKRDLKSPEGRLKNLYFSGKPGERAIDKVAEPQPRKRLYTHALEQYKREWQEGQRGLTIPDMIEIIIGYQLLCDRQLEGGSTTLQCELIQWVHTAIIPRIESMDEADRDQLLTAVMNGQEICQQSPVPKDARWEHIAPYSYRLFRAKGPLKIDIYSMDISVGGNKQVRKRKTFLPATILCREEVRQALQVTNSSKVAVIEEKPGSYCWQCEGQEFSLSVVGPTVTIQRTIDGRRYTFHCIQPVAMHSDATALLGDHGLWIDDSNATSGHIFTKGMRAPKKPEGLSAPTRSATDHYIALLDTEAKKVLAVETTEGLKVSSAEHVGRPSPVLFADAKEVLVVVDAAGAPCEMHLKHADISLYRRQEHWICYQGDEEWGQLAHPKEEQKLIAHCGGNWDQFVIPLQDKAGKEIYLLIPYVHKVDSKNKVFVNQLSFPNIESLELMTLQSDGTIQGTIASDLYLTHRLLLQASRTRNSSEANKLYLEAERHLQQLANSRMPSDPAREHAIMHAIELIASHPPLSVEGLPLSTALALNLRLLLVIRRLRSGARAAALPAEKNLSELEQIAKLHEMYLMQQQPGAPHSPYKYTFTLNGDEMAELHGINNQLLHELVKDNPGNTGDRAYQMQMALPNRVDHQFVLTLLRLACQVDPAKDIRTIVAPLPLDGLLANFWSYLSSIQEHDVPCDKLSVLFEESLLPPAASPEEKRRWQAIDLQARQFLLAYAHMRSRQNSLMERFKESGGKQLKAAQEEVRKQTSPDAPLRLLLKGLSPTLMGHFDSLSNAVLECKIIEKEQENSGKKIIDFTKLISDLSQLQTTFFTFSTSLKAVIKDANDFESEIKVKYKKNQDALFQLIRERKKIIDDNSEKLEECEQSLHSMTEKLNGHNRELELSRGEGVKEKKEIVALTRSRCEALEQERNNVVQDHEKKLKDIDSKITSKEQELQEIRAKKEKEPTMQNEVSGQEVIDGKYRSTMRLDELQQLSQWTSEQQQSIKNLHLQIQNGQNMVEKLAIMDNACTAIKNKPFSPTPNLHFAEGDKATQEILKVINNPNIEEEKLQLVKDSVQAMGLWSGFCLIKDLLSYKAGDLKEKASTFFIPLEGIVEVAHLLNDEPIIVGSPSIGQQPLQCGDIANHTIARQYFTEKELSLVQSRLNSLPADGRESYISRLMGALNRSSFITNAQTGLARNMEDIFNCSKELYFKILNKKNSQEPSQPPSQLIVQENLLHRYEGFFQENSGLPSDLRQLAEEFDAACHGQGNVCLQTFVTTPADQKNEVLQGPLGRAAFLPIVKALELLVHAQQHHEINIAKNFFASFRNCKTTLEAVTLIRDVYRVAAFQLSEKQHHSLVDELIKKTLPQGDESDRQYACDLKQGFNNIKENNPLPYANVIGYEAIDKLDEEVKKHAEELKELVESDEQIIVKGLKTVPINQLPKEFQSIRRRQGSDKELLKAAYRWYSKGSFANGDNDAVDNQIGICQANMTRLQLLQDENKGAQAAIQALRSLKQQRQLLLSDYDKQGADKGKVAEQLKAVEMRWCRESLRLQDCLGRCQSTSHLQRLSSRLQRHKRKIIYLQQRLNMVLRKNQIDALDQIISNPSMLKQLRMGLGKTKVLLPFALEILASEGYNVIGMVPKELFTTNFDEMDATTRLIFELAGNRFCFSSNDVPRPFSEASLYQLSQQCADFLRAAAKGEYILTTIESTAALRNKIEEVKASRAQLLKEYGKLSDNNSEELNGQRAGLYGRLVDHQMVLNMLYSVKKLFKHENTRLIVDEGDQVLRPNYSVNSEPGGEKNELPPPLSETVSAIFAMIRDEPGLQEVKNAIRDNNQIALKEKQVNDHLEKIGAIWLKGCYTRLPEKWQSASEQKKIVIWLAGGSSPFSREDLKELGAFATELAMMSRALNSGLRASFKMKVGGKAAQDFTHHVIGVPASQGVPSPKTRYSDPLMQLCLTHMVAMYTPPGEPFLSSAIGEIYDTLKKDSANAQKIGNKKILYEEAINKLGALIKKQREGERVDWATALAGQENWQLLVRAECVPLTVGRGLIYIAQAETSSAVQHVLKGANLIVLTGTATRNLAHVIGSNGNKKGLEGLEHEGRQSTAEVVYRLAKSSPQGLDTPIDYYPVDRQQAWEQFKSFAKKDSGTNILINQAGVCDQYTQRQIVAGLHEVAKRPIVFLDSETGEKLVWIGGIKKTKEYEKLTPEETKEAFFYYQCTRGVHFDIPTGSSGVLMLLPTVTADDRDQAAYRARELGEGHNIRPYISERQWEEFGGGQKSVTLADVLRVNHENTAKEEAQSDLEAYKLHLNGIVIAAAEDIEEAIQAEQRGKLRSHWLRQDKRPDCLKIMEGEEFLAELFRTLFIQEGGNELYLEGLAIELDRGERVVTQQYLLGIISRLERRTKKFIDKIEEENLKKSEPANSQLREMLKIAKGKMVKIQEQLVKEKTKIETQWQNISKQVPEVVAATASIVGTVETEAENEMEGEKEQETEAEKESIQRAQGTASVLMACDEEMAKSVTTPFNFEEGVISAMNSMLSTHSKSSAHWLVLPASIPTGGATPGQGRLSHELIVAISPSVKKQGSFRQASALVVQFENKNHILLADAQEGMVFLTGYQWGRAADMPKIQRAGLITIDEAATGELSLKYTVAAPMVMDWEKEFNEDGTVQAELLLALLSVGIAQLSEPQWGTIDHYWQNILDLDQKSIWQKKFEEMQKTNPTLFKAIADHLWDKPQSKQLALGGGAVLPKQEEHAGTKYRDEAQAWAAIQEAYNNDKMLNVRVWVSKNVEDVIHIDIRAWTKNLINMKK